VEEELDIDGDDKAVYGEAQFTEGDVLPVHTERGDSIEDDFQINIEDEGQGAHQTLQTLVSHSAIKIRKRTDPVRQESPHNSSGLDGIDLSMVATQHGRDRAGLVKLVVRHPALFSLLIH
jgi:hypothetical protein